MVAVSTIVVGRPRRSFSWILPSITSRKPMLKNKTSRSASHSNVASRIASPARASWASAVLRLNDSPSKTRITGQSSHLRRRSPRRTRPAPSVPTGRTLAADREKAEQIGEGEREPTRAGVDAEADVAGQIDRNASEPGITLGRASQIAAGAHTVDAGAGEGVDTEHRTAPPVERDPVLAAEPEGIMPVTDLDDLRSEEVRGRAPIEVDAEHAVRQEVAEVTDVELFE